MYYVGEELAEIHGASSAVGGMEGVYNDKRSNSQISGEMRRFVGLEENNKITLFGRSVPHIGITKNVGVDSYWVLQNRFHPKSDPERLLKNYKIKNRYFKNIH